MISYFLLLVVVLLVLVLGLSFLAKADPKKVARALRYIGGIALFAIALALVARGLMIYAVPVAIAGYALLQGRSPFPSSFPGSAQKSSGQQSRVRTSYLEMRLDHDSGEMDGLVLKGKFANRMVSDLQLEELVILWRECRRYDGQAAQLLEAYIDRTHPDWRDITGEGEDDAEAHPGASGNGGAMTLEEAYEVLGLTPGADKAAIRKAHRQLMKKLHPDQGGSTYLASKINEAKDLLLNQR